MPVAMSKGGATYYLAYDQVGSLRAVYNASGALVKQVTYDTFGNILSDSAPTFTVPFGFAGGLHDRDTNLVHFGYRDYDPETGRWTAKDPIGFNGGDVDLMGYVQYDPVNFVDPLGLQVVCPPSQTMLTNNFNGSLFDTGRDYEKNPITEDEFEAENKAGNDLYWRYYQMGKNSPYQPWLTGKNEILPPYGRDYSLAKDRLQIPDKYMPNNVGPVWIRRSEPVAGPRPVVGYPEYGNGGGTEYYRGQPYFPPDNNGGREGYDY